MDPALMPDLSLGDQLHIGNLAGLDLGGPGDGTQINCDLVFDHAAVAAEPVPDATPPPKPLLLVVRDDVDAAEPNPGSSLSARCIDDGDVLHTYIPDNHHGPRPHGDFDIPVVINTPVTTALPPTPPTTLAATDDTPAPPLEDVPPPSPAAATSEGFSDFVQITKADDGELSAVRITPSGVIDLQVGFIPGPEELCSRNKGILETDLLASKTVAVMGLGSGGSVVTDELAKAGVGKFLLFDNERLELCNIARHVCDVRDIGRLKTNAMRDQVKSRNPYAAVLARPMDVIKQKAELKQLLIDEGVDLLIMATDTATSRGVLNELALELGIVAIFGRTIVRAAGGDVLRVRPNYAAVAQGAPPRQHPCLNCVFTRDVNLGEAEISSIEQAKVELPAYVGEHDIAKAVTPGLAADIAPISNFMVKIALLELSREAPGLPPSHASGLRSLDEDFKHTDFWTYANRREDLHSGLTPLGMDNSIVPPLPVGAEGAAGTGARKPDDMRSFSTLCQAIAAPDSGIEYLDARIKNSGQFVLRAIHPASDCSFDLVLRRNATASGLDATLCQTHGPRYPTVIVSDPWDVGSIVDQMRKAMDPRQPQATSPGLCKRPFDQTICRWYGASTPIGCATCSAYSRVVGAALDNDLCRSTLAEATTAAACAEVGAAA